MSDMSLHTILELKNDEENNILFDNKKAGEWLKSKINGKED